MDSEYARPPADIITRDDLIAILRDPLALDWRAHGIGFVKAYLEPTRTWRLNLYNKAIRTPGISTLHDHPWPLKSFIMSGTLYNTRYEPCARGAAKSKVMNEGVISCAKFNGLEGPPNLVSLRAKATETYHAGMTYSQIPSEVHETDAVDGTATVIRMGARSPEGTARVYWPAGQEWGDASRSLTFQEVKQVADIALRLLMETN